MSNLRKFEHILNEGISQEDLANTLCHRIEMRYPDIYKKYDYDAMYNAVDDVASFHAGAEELGSSDISMMIRQVFKRLEESEGVTEGIARGPKEKALYQLLEAWLGFISLKATKIARDAIDINGQQMLASMQKYYLGPVLNGMTMGEILQGDLWQNPKVIPHLLKYVYQGIPYIEERIKKFVKPAEQQNYLSDAGGIAKIKRLYKEAVAQYSQGQQGVAEGYGELDNLKAKFEERVASIIARAKEEGRPLTDREKKAIAILKGKDQGVAEGSSSKLSSPFEGGKKTKTITPKHKPLVWENMLGTVMAKDPTSKAEPKYFDYRWEDARAYAKVDQCDDLRICKSPGLYQGWPEKGKMALWGIPRQGVAEGYKEPTDAAGHAKMAAKIKKMLDDTLADRGDRHGNPDPERLTRAYEYHMKKAEEKSQGVAEEKGTLWRVHQSEATGRYHVVKGYNKDIKMYKNKMSAGDFNSKASAQAKADELNSSVKETFYRNTDGSIRVVDHKRESKELNVGDTFEYGFFGTKKGIGTVVKLEGFPGKEFVVGKTMDGKISKFPYRGAMPKNGYYIKKIKSSNIRQSELNEAVDESWINAYKALEANGGEPTLDKPRLFIQQMAIIAKDMGIQPKYTTMEDEWEKVKPFTSLLSQYVDPEGQKFVNYGASIWQALRNAPSMTEIKKYAQQSQSQDVAYQQQQQMSALQHDLTIQQLLRKNELEKADSDALVQMDFEARQAIKERQQQLELEAKEKFAQIEIDIRNSREPEEVRKHEFEMAKLNHAHEVQVIRVTAEGEMKKAQLEADYQIKIKQLENIDNQQERQNRLDVINTEKYKELARIDAETSAKVKELQAETNAERERTDIAVGAERERSEIEIASQQAQSDIRIREEFMNEFKPIWANLIQRASEAGRTIGQNINAMMAALSRMGKPTMPQANKINELKCWDGYKRVPGTTAGEPGSCEKINELLSTEKLGQYKKAAGADARAADEAGKFERGNKRFRGINKATKKQFDNETKPKKESAIMKGIQNETLGTPYPGTYEQEFGPFKRKGSERIMKLTTEGKKNVSRRT